MCVCVCVCAARGNSTACAEFNFAADPEAAHIVLNEFLCPTYIATWEFTCRNKLSWVSGSARRLTLPLPVRGRCKLRYDVCAGPVLMERETTLW